MYLGAPQIIMLVILALGGGIALALHGKPRDDHNFFLWFISFLITMGLLWWGGFFAQ
jgi:hypothetical protein